jgi:hypothetical protein
MVEQITGNSGVRESDDSVGEVSAEEHSVSVPQAVTDDNSNRIQNSANVSAPAEVDTDHSTGVLSVSGTPDQRLNENDSIQDANRDSYHDHSYPPSDRVEREETCATPAKSVTGECSPDDRVGFSPDVTGEINRGNNSTPSNSVQKFNCRCQREKSNPPASPHKSLSECFDFVSQQISSLTESKSSPTKVPKMAPPSTPPEENRANVPMVAHVVEQNAYLDDVATLVHSSESKKLRNKVKNARAKDRRKKEGSPPSGCGRKLFTTQSSSSGSGKHPHNGGGPSSVVNAHQPTPGVPSAASMPTSVANPTVNIERRYPARGNRSIKSGTVATSTATSTTTTSVRRTRSGTSVTVAVPADAVGNKVVARVAVPREGVSDPRSDGGAGRRQTYDKKNLYLGKLAALETIPWLGPDTKAVMVLGYLPFIDMLNLHCEVAGAHYTEVSKLRSRPLHPEEPNADGSYPKFGKDITKTEQREKLFVRYVDLGWNCVNPQASTQEGGNGGVQQEVPHEGEGNQPDAEARQQDIQQGSYSIEDVQKNEEHGHRKFGNTKMFQQSGKTVLDSLEARSNKMFNLCFGENVTVTSRELRTFDYPDGIVPEEHVVVGGMNDGTATQSAPGSGQQAIENDKKESAKAQKKSGAVKKKSAAASQNTKKQSSLKDPPPPAMNKAGGAQKVPEQCTAKKIPPAKLIERMEMHCVRVVENSGPGYHQQFHVTAFEALAKAEELRTTGELQSCPWKVGYAMIVPLCREGYSCRLAVPTADDNGRDFVVRNLSTPFGSVLYHRLDLLKADTLGCNRQKRIEAVFVPKSTRGYNNKAPVWLTDPRIVNLNLNIRQSRLLPHCLPPADKFWPQAREVTQHFAPSSGSNYESNMNDILGCPMRTSYYSPFYVHNEQSQRNNFKTRVVQTGTRVPKYPKRDTDYLAELVEGFPDEVETDELKEEHRDLVLGHQKKNKRKVETEQDDAGNKTKKRKETGNDTGVIIERDANGNPVETMGV